MNKSSPLYKIIQYLNENYQSVKNIELCKDGINSQVLKIEFKDGVKNALKIYPSEDSKRERLTRELKFLNFLKNINFKNCPNVTIENFELNFILISWIDGCKIKKPSKNNLEDLRKFYEIINKSKKKAIDIPLASEAFFEISLLYEHLRGLIHNYQNNFPKHSKFHSLEINLINSMKKDILEIGCIIENDKTDPINFENHKILSQSDIGFHNIIKNRDGIYFIDFEYSGWDNPMKLLSDWILQPSGFYTFKKPINFFMNFSEEIGINSKMKKKLYQYLLIYRLRWVLIKMNKLKDKNNHKMVDTPKTLSEIFSYYKMSLEYIQKYADKDGRIINY